jgi:hypothetical protein
MPAGARYGRLTVIEEAPGVGTGPSSSCRCACGAIVTVLNNFLVWGRTLSCGCLKREATVRMGERNRTHGRTGSAEYRAWRGLRDRCTKPRVKNYKDYGGRGITVCPEWSSFERFYADMGPRPSPRHSLDRIDNDGPYSAENCRWAMPVEQLRNRRTTRRLTYRGQTMTIAAWAGVVGLPWRVIADRVRLGWPLERALTEPPRASRPHRS